MGKTILAILCALALGFAWGVAALRLEVFPYNLVKSSGHYRNPRLLARREYFARHHPPAQLVFIGDSITRMIEWGEAFPGALNRGIDGDTTRDVLDRLQDLVMLNARQYVILLGTNDRLQGVPIEQTVRNMQRIVDALPGDKLILAVPPCAPRYGSCDQAAIDRLNDRLAGVGGTRFARTTLRPQMLVDEVHPDARGMDELVADVRAAGI